MLYIDKLVLRIITIIILTLLLGTGLSCKESPKKKNAPTPTEEYLQTGFTDKYNPLDMAQADKFKSKYYFEQSRPFKGFYGLLNAFKKRNNYNVVALLDYTQVPVSFNDVSSDNHALSLGPFSQKVYNLKTPSLKKGFHDFIMVTFKSLDNHDKSAKYRFGPLALAARSNIVVGKYNGRKYNETNFSKSIKKVRSGNVTLNRKAKDNNIAIKEQDRLGQKINFFIHLANNSKFRKNYALVGFINAKQTDIQKRKALFTSVKPKTELVIPWNFVIDKDLGAGTYELTIVAIGSPGTLMDDKKTQALPGYDERIIFSNRIALTVK